MGDLKFNLYDLEIDMHEQCNLKCIQCSHASPYFKNKDHSYSLEQFTKDIKILSNVCTINSIRLVGGEPLLNKNLVDYIKVIRRSNICKELKMFTNGLLLHLANPEMFSLLDTVKISIYSNLEEKKLDLIQANIKKLKEEHPNLNVVSNEISYFLKSNLLERNTNKELVNEIYNKCYYSYGHRGVSIFNGRLYKCFASRKKYKILETHNQLNEDLKTELDPSKIDSIALDDTLTAKRLEDFIQTKYPLKGCEWCLGTCGKKIAHTQYQNISENIATLEDIDFQEGEIYISNNILSWSRHDKSLGDLKNNKFFKIEHLKHYIKSFKF